jgi:hypothetical protein
MRIKTEFPRPYRQIDDFRIPMPDGITLGARLWLPEDAESEPVPAIIEATPYRKDLGYFRAKVQQGYFAGHGYAALHLDLRGSGASEGVLDDEYSAQELDDIVSAIGWIAKQPWCDGQVGLFGLSWSGFNALQVAALQPPELKAVVTVGFTDDRYADDVHYRGGCVFASDMLPWAGVFQELMAYPPPPAVFGDRWREVWLERLEQSPLYIETWMRHQRRDAYWKHGSVCEDYGKISVPVYAVSGWYDGYSNAVPRLLEGLSGPKKGLIGPWAHFYPEFGVPGPAIGFLQECLRWWDYWFKGVETGVMDEPLLRCWMIESHASRTGYQDLPGRWVAEERWPSLRLTPQDYWLGGHGLGLQPGDQELSIRGSQQHGMLGGVWSGHGEPGTYPTDQRPDDALALAFDSEPLGEPLEILGYPEVRLSLSADRPLALVSARLCDVRPDGSSALVSSGLLNLTHRESHEFPSPLTPGQRYAVDFRLRACAWSFPAGHRLRLTLSPTDWPNAWPSPEIVTLTVHTQESRLRLPVRPPRPEDERLRPFEPAEIAAPYQQTVLSSEPSSSSLERDLETGRFRLHLVNGETRTRYEELGLEMESWSETELAINEDDPLSAKASYAGGRSFKQGGWQARAAVEAEMSADAADFHVVFRVEAWEGENRVFERTRTLSIPRDHG